MVGGGIGVRIKLNPTPATRLALECDYIIKAVKCKIHVYSSCSLYGSSCLGFPFRLCSRLAGSSSTWTSLVGSFTSVTATTRSVSFHRAESASSSSFARWSSSCGSPVSSPFFLRRSSQGRFLNGERGVQVVRTLRILHSLFQRLAVCEADLFRELRGRSFQSFEVQCPEHVRCCCTKHVSVLHTNL